jgi:hypothetical protein
MDSTTVHSIGNVLTGAAGTVLVADAVPSNGSAFVEIVKLFVPLITIVFQFLIFRNHKQQKVGE